MKVFEALVEAFTQEGVRHAFGLMGDGNMDFLAALLDRGAIKMYDTRHEGAALAMADGYARASRDVGVATVTCGPGVTQLGTSMTVANRHGSPIVVLAGDTPNGLKGMGALQDMDQRAFAEASGALFHQLRGPGTVAADVQQAFWLARTRRLPVLLNCPIDVQEAEAPSGFAYRPSAERIKLLPPLAPDPDSVERAADMLAQARRPVIVAGAGAVASGARAGILGIGERIGAAYATTIRGKGYLDGPWSIGICGTFATLKGEPILAAADLVVFVGSSVTANVNGSGSLFPRARTLQIDSDPLALVGGRSADHLVIAESRLAVDAISARLAEAEYTAPGYRDGTFAKIFAMDPLSLEMARVPFELAAGETDPRRVIQELDNLLPEESNVVIGAGHFWSFPTVYLNGGRSRRFFYTYDFGCIGQAVPTAFGIAIADPSRPTVVFEGDASAIMNIHEFDTTARYRPRMLVVIMNDGALGAEYHKLRSKGHDPEWSVVATPDLARLTAAFGNSGTRVTDPTQLQDAVAAFVSGSGTHVIEVRTSTAVPSRYYRRAFLGSLE
jgi:thiamine pyrophosphate-dependent acetolactate synthase large subunit-like protein